MKSGRACAALAALAGGLASFGTDDGRAEWTPAVSGTLTMSIEEGTWLGPGRKVAFGARAIEFGSTESGAAGVTTMSVRVHRGHAWHFRMSAPDGLRLEAGEYTHARGANDVNHPGLDVSGAGRGCSNSSGSFTVHEVEYGPHDYVERFRATFDFACHPGAPRLLGEVDLAAQPAPEALMIEVTYESGRIVERIDGGIVAELRGTVQCSRPVTAVVSAQVMVESAPKAVGGVEVDRCSLVAQPWAITSTTSPSLFEAEALATIVAQATDEWHTERAGGDPVVAEDLIEGAEVDALPRSADDGLSVGIEWLALIAAAALALAGWSFLVARWARGRGRSA